MTRTIIKATLLTSVIFTALLIISSPIVANGVLQVNTTPTLQYEIQQSAVSFTFLKPFNASFIAYRSGSDVGEANIALEALTKDNYELRYQSKLKRFFLSDKRYEKTTFSYTEGQLVPHTYDYRRTGTGSNKSLSLVFDQNNKTIAGIGDAKTPWNDELDNQLFRIDFPNQITNGIYSAHYKFINYRGQKREYTLEVIGIDNLALPYGNISAIKVLVGRESSSRLTYAWFAPSLNFNLVRLQQFKDDDEQADMQLSSFEYL